MKVYATYTVLKTFEVPEEWTDKEIVDYIEYFAPEDYNDMVFDVEEDQGIVL